MRLIPRESGPDMPLTTYLQAAQSRKTVCGGLDVQEALRGAG